MSEAELHVLRGRLRQGLLNKVRRGAVFLGPPVGYIRSQQGGFEFDHDEQVCAVVRMIFEQFERHGRARKVAKTLIEQNIKIGVRPHAGPNRGQLDWRTAATSTICKILKHPIYAGIYAYGRTRVDPRRRASGKRLLGGDKTWTVWDVETGKVILRGPAVEPGGVITVAVTPDGSRFLTGGYSDTVCIWDAVTGRQVQEIQAGVGFVLAAVFTTDGKSILVSGGSGKASVTLPGGPSAVRLWSLESRP